MYDGTELIIDCTTISPWKRSFNSDIQHLIKFAEHSKKSKYEVLRQPLNRTRGRNIRFVPIAISIFGTIGSEGLHFLDDLGKLLKESGCVLIFFDFWIWKNRIVFSLLKAFPRDNSILNNITEFYNNRVAIQVNSENLPSLS
ncbi:hypothetical protein P9112_003867 [Eukaryota sp. TZLM1-RC]